MEQLLGPVSTRNLLISFLWVLKNVDNELLQMWWSQLSISRYTLSTEMDGCVTQCGFHFHYYSVPIFRFNILMDVMELSVACFEYRVSYAAWGTCIYVHVYVCVLC